MRSCFVHRSAPVTMATLPLKRCATPSIESRSAQVAALQRAGYPGLGPSLRMGHVCLAYALRQLDAKAQREPSLTGHALGMPLRWVGNKWFVSADAVLAAASRVGCRRKRSSKLAVIV